MAIERRVERVIITPTKKYDFSKMIKQRPLDLAALYAEYGPEKYNKRHNRMSIVIEVFLTKALCRHLKNIGEKEKLAVMSKYCQRARNNKFYYGHNKRLYTVMVENLACNGIGWGNPLAIIDYIFNHYPDSMVVLQCEPGEQPW